MGDASATGAPQAGAEKQAATDAVKSGEDSEQLKKKFDAQAKQQRELYEAERAKLMQEQQALKQTFDAELAKERERALKAEKALQDAEARRIAKLDERAKGLPDAAQKLAQIAKDKGSDAYEEALAAAEALVAANRPKGQGGNIDGNIDSARELQRAELSKLPESERLTRAREIDARTKRG